MSERASCFLVDEYIAPAGSGRFDICEIHGPDNTFDPGFGYLLTRGYTERALGEFESLEEARALANARGYSELTVDSPHAVERWARPQRLRSNAGPAPLSH